MTLSLVDFIQDSLLFLHASIGFNNLGLTILESPQFLKEVTKKIPKNSQQYFDTVPYAKRDDTAFRQTTTSIFAICQPIYKIQIPSEPS